MQYSLSIVIVNWNAGLLLSDCINSLRKFADDERNGIEILIVDNASSDDSIERFRDDIGIRLICNQSNLGFAAACNQGASASRGEAILFLNPDCRVGAASIEAAINVLRTDTSVGVVGVALYDDTGVIWRSCHRLPRAHHLYSRALGLAQSFPLLFDSTMSEWDHQSDRDVDHIIGAFYMIRRSLFECLDGFDERFQVYLEDLDLSLRVRRAGYRIRFIAGAPAYHKGGGTSDRVKAYRIFLSTQSRVLYMFKHYGSVHGWIHLVLTLAIEPACRVASLLLRGRWREVADVGAAFSTLTASLPNTLSKRHASTNQL